MPRDVRLTDLNSIFVRSAIDSGGLCDYHRTRSMKDNCTVSKKTPRRRATRAAGPRRVLLSLWMNGVFGADVIDGVHSWLHDSGANWRIRFADSDKHYAKSLLWMLDGKALDGVISFYQDEFQDAALLAAGVPYVHFGECLAGETAAEPPSLAASVDVDLGAIASAAADHLLARAGFRSAGFAENYFDHGWSRRRGDAVVAEFRRRGVAVHRFRHYGRPSGLNAVTGPDFEGMTEWLRALEKPSAVVAANDQTADDIIRICEAEGIAVPRDVAVLGMDDNPVFCRHSEPNISSIHFDGRAAGRNAAAALAEMMAGRPPPPREALLYSCTAIANRGSTAATPSIGDIVQRAADFIDANACRGASLVDVVRHCHYSRTLVTLRFRQMTGKSVAQALRERRLAEARRLLRETSMTVEEIAPLCGYESPRALSRAFVSLVGLTIGEWRRKESESRRSDPKSR